MEFWTAWVTPLASPQGAIDVAFAYTEIGAFVVGCVFLVCYALLVHHVSSVGHVVCDAKDR